MADYDEEKYERLANELRALYVDAEHVMLRRVAKRIAKGVTQPGWTEKKAAEISAARQEIEEAIQNLEERAREAWTPAIEESYRKGWVSGKTDIERFGDTVGTTHLSPNSLKAASILQELDQSISAADRRILRQFDDEYAGIIGKASALMATGSITTREAVQQALTEFADAGISGFTDRAGRRWELGNYAEMAVLTAIEKASVEGYTDTMQAYGYDLAIISSHAGSCPLCEAWEGVIVSVSGENTEYPSLDEAEGAGAFHPRCLHHLETYYEGISEKKWGGKLRSEPRELEEPSKQYTQRSLQRYNERQIRKYKRRMAVAVTPEAERRAYNKVRQWQAAQRQLIDDSDGQLLRQYQREGGRQNLRLQSKPIRIRPPQALTIRSPIEQRHTGKGVPGAIIHIGRPLNNRQKTLLDRLPKTGSRVVVRKKDVSMKDLSALTASTGNEFAMFTKGGERLIVRGNAYRTPIGIKEAKELREEGYRWSGHTHPGIDHNCLQASSGDIGVLNVFGQEFSVIYNSIGAYQVFS